MSAIQRSEPRTRIRINHSRTQRDGWQYETTVEIEWTGDDIDVESSALMRLQSLQEDVRELGERERDMRNAADGRNATP